MCARLRIRAALFCFPAAVLLGVDFWLVVGGAERGIVASIAGIVISWVGLILFATRAAGVRQAFGRAAAAFAVAAFGLPIAALMYTLALILESVSGASGAFGQLQALISASLAGTLVVVIAAIIGFFTGLSAAMLAYFALKSPSAD